MTASLSGPRSKIERAKRHVQEFEAAMRGLVVSKTTHPDVIVTEDDPDNVGNVRYKLARIPPVPDQIAAIAGDAIHNMRSALDLLMTQLVERASGKSMRGQQTPYFPFDRTRERLEARLTPKIEARIGKDAVDCIRTSEPHLGGKGEVAFYLHHLDIEDKHRVVYALGFHMRSLTIGFPSWGDLIPDPALAAQMDASLAKAAGSLFFLPADTMFPLKEGDVLHSTFPNPVNDPKFALDVVFAEPEIVQAQPVLPTLTQYVEAASALVESFAPLF